MSIMCLLLRQVFIETFIHGVVPLKESDWKKTVFWQPANPHPVVKKLPLNPVVRGPRGPQGTLPSEIKFSEAIELHYSMGTDGHIAALSNQSLSQHWLNIEW